MNQGLYDQLANATQFYQVCQKAKDEIEYLETIQPQALESEQQRFQDKKFGGPVTLKVLSMIGLIMFAVFSIVLIVAGRVDSEAMYRDVGGALYYWGIVFLSFWVFIFFVFLRILGGILYRSAKKKIQKHDLEVTQAAIAESKKKAVELCENLNVFCAQNQEVIEFLPMSYRNLEASAYMMLAVGNGRADSLKEAINVYEEQLHRWKMENAARQAAEAQQYMALAVEELNERQAETNSRLAAIQLMQVVDLFTD